MLCPPTFTPTPTPRARRAQVYALAKRSKGRLPASLPFAVAMLSTLAAEAVHRTVA
jgi:hypothetical protein